MFWSLDGSATSKGFIWFLLDFQVQHIHRSPYANAREGPTYILSSKYMQPDCVQPDFSKHVHFSNHEPWFFSHQCVCPEGGNTGSGRQNGNRWENKINKLLDTTTTKGAWADERLCDGNEYKDILIGHNFWREISQYWTRMTRGHVSSAWACYHMEYTLKGYRFDHMHANHLHRNWRGLGL